MAKRGKPKDEDEAGLVAPPAASTGTFEQLYPRLAWELQADNWDGPKGGRRLRSGLSIFHQDGMVKACLRERNMGQVAFLSGVSVDAVLRALDEALDTVQMDWRPDKFFKKTGGD